MANGGYFWRSFCSGFWCLLVVSVEIYPWLTGPSTAQLNTRIITNRPYSFWLLAMRTLLLSLSYRAKPSKLNGKLPLSFIKTRITAFLYYASAYLTLLRGSPPGGSHKWIFSYQLSQQSTQTHFLVWKVTESKKKTRSSQGLHKTSPFVCIFYMVL